MVVTKPRREEISRIVGADPRLIRAFEALFEQTEDTSVSDSDFLLLQAYLSTGISRAAALQDVNALLTVRTITASDSVQFTDQAILCDASGGALTVTLPVASDNLGRTLRIKKSDSTAAIVSVAPTGSDLIDGNASVDMPRPYTALLLVSDASNWWII